MAEPGSFRTTAARWGHVAAVVMGSLALTAIVHDVPALLNQPFWLDELWVAVSARFPLADLPQLTACTPIGWNALQRMLAPFGDQAQRLVSLAFGSAAVGAAYAVGWLAVRQPLPRRVATGALVALAVAFSPSMLARGDLKPFTADAATALAVVALVIVADRARGREELTALVSLTALASIGLLVSLTIVFWAAAAFGSLSVAALSRRDTLAARRLLVATAIAGPTMIAIYHGVYRPARIPALVEYWNDYYPTLASLPIDTARRTAELLALPSTFLGAVAVAGVLALLGLLAVASWHSGDRALALVGPFGCGAVAAAAVVRAYPYLDARTSLHLLAVLKALLALVLARLALAAIDGIQQPAAVGNGAVVEPAVAEASPRAGRTVGSLLALGALGTMVILLGAPAVRTSSSLRQDVRSAVRTVRRDLAAGDVVVVEQPGAFGIAYYWPEAGARWHRTADMANGFLIAFPAGGPIVERNGDMTLEAQLRALARDHDGAAWLISSHRELDGLAELRASYPVEVLHVGVEPVYRLEFAALAPADRALRRREAGPSQPGPWTHAARSGSQP